MGTDTHSSVIQLKLFIPLAFVDSFLLFLCLDVFPAASASRSGSCFAYVWLHQRVHADNLCVCCFFLGTLLDNDDV